MRKVDRTTLFILALLLLFTAPGQAQQIGQCQIFPDDNIWNTPIDTLPVHSNSAAYIQTIGTDRTLRADFGSGLWEGAPIGIPYITVPGNQPKVAVTFEYDDESDAGPYPVPADAPIEGGPDSDGDRHVIMVDTDNCILYELYAAYPQNDGTWQAGSGAIYDLNSHTLRPDGWTSADAAGLPILPGLVRYDEVASGEITHAIRFTVPQTQRAYLWPARHFASSLTGTEYPPMGLRLRLKANFDISGYSPEIQVILRALKKYGLILADNGSSYYMSGAPDERWDNNMLRELLQITGSNLEAVDVSGLMISANSGQSKDPSTVGGGDGDGGDNSGIPVAPQNIRLIPNQGRPELVWGNDENADWYNIWIGGGGQTVLFGWFPKPGAIFANTVSEQVACAGLTCTLKPNINPGAGTYQVWMQAWGGDSLATGHLSDRNGSGASLGLPGWNEAQTTLSYPDSPPNAITPLTTTVADTGEVTLQWQGVQNATWYNVWIGTAPQGWSQRFLGWMLAEDLGCENAEVCILTQGVKVFGSSDFNLKLTSPGDYVYYVQSWGPGGFSTGGKYGSWAESPTFTIPEPDGSGGLPPGE